MEVGKAERLMTRRGKPVEVIPVVDVRTAVPADKVDAFFQYRAGFLCQIRAVKLSAAEKASRAAVRAKISEARKEANKASRATESAQIKKARVEWRRQKAVLAKKLVEAKKKARKSLSQADIVMVGAAKEAIAVHKSSYPVHN